MADTSDYNTSKELLQSYLDSRPEFHVPTELKAITDLVMSRFTRRSESTEEFGRSGTIINQPLTLEKSEPLTFRKGNTLSCTKDQIHRSTKHNQSSSTSSTSSKLPVKIKRSQPTTTNCSKRIKTSNVWTRSTYATNILQNVTDRCVRASATATLSVPAQDLQGMDEPVVNPEGSSADRSGYPEYTTLWIPD